MRRFRAGVGAPLRLRGGQLRRESVRSAKPPPFRLRNEIAPSPLGEPARASPAKPAPLIPLSGARLDFRRSVGFAIVGGLAVSQALALFTMPVVYIFLERVRRRFDERRCVAWVHA
jgi:hypothetical protein